MPAVAPLRYFVPEFRKIRQIVERLAAQKIQSRVGLTPAPAREVRLQRALKQVGAVSLHEDR